MNYSIWDKLDEKIEEKANIEETKPIRRRNGAETARTTSPLPETHPKDKSPESAEYSAPEPTFNEGAIWQANEELLASVPEESRIPIKLGILEEYILQGLRSGADRTGLFLAAILGLALANNHTAFYTEVKAAISK